NPPPPAPPITKTCPLNTTTPNLSRAVHGAAVEEVHAAPLAEAFPDPVRLEDVAPHGVQAALVEHRPLPVGRKPRIVEVGGNRTRPLHDHLPSVALGFHIAIEEVGVGREPSGDRIRPARLQ